MTAIDALGLGDADGRRRPTDAGPSELASVDHLRAAAAAPAATMDVPFVDLPAVYAAQRDQIDRAIAGVLERSDFVLGAALDRFEQEFAAYCDVSHAVGVDSGYSALELCLRAYDIGAGDEVITAANTFVATVGAIDAVGARPVLVDVLPDTYTLDPQGVLAAVTPATRAIIPVHLYGQPAQMAAINEIADAHGLVVIEDACQAHGARYRGARAGSLGDAAAFSFYPAKNLGALGDGGMVVTDDSEVASRVRKLRNLGSTTKYVHDVKGFNRRLDTLHAAVLSVKLAQLDADNAARRRTAWLYGELLRDAPVQAPDTASDVEHVHHLYVLQVDERERLRSHLSAAGIATGIHYPVPIHRQPAYRAVGNGSGRYPVTDAAAPRILSLPMYPGIPDAAVAHTAGWIIDFYSS